MVGWSSGRTDSSYFTGSRFCLHPILTVRRYIHAKITPHSGCGKLLRPPCLMAVPLARAVVLCFDRRDYHRHGHHLPAIPPQCASFASGKPAQRCYSPASSTATAQRSILQDCAEDQLVPDHPYRDQCVLSEWVEILSPSDA